MYACMFELLARATASIARDHGTAMMMLHPSRGGRSARRDAARHGDAPLSHHRRVARPSSPRTLATTMRGSIMVYGVHHPPLRVGRAQNDGSGHGGTLAARSRAVGVVDLLVDSRRVVHMHGEPRARRGGVCAVGSGARAAHCVGMAATGGRRGGGRHTVELVPRGVESCPTVGFSLEGPSRRGAAFSGQSMVRSGLSGVWGNEVQ